MHIVEEFQLKRARLVRVMEEEDLTALLIRRQDNFAWLSCGGNSAVVTNADTGVGSLFVSRKGDNILVTNNIEADRLLEEEGLKELGFAASTHLWSEDGERALVAALAGDGSKVGCDAPYPATRDLSRRLCECRRELTEGERLRYRLLGRKLSLAVEIAMHELRPGVTEGEVAGRIAAELWKDRIDVTNFLVAFDERIYRHRHPVTVNRPLARQAMLSVNARYKGLLATITRLGYLGEIPENLHRQYRDTVLVECRMIAATRPGVEERAILRLAAESYAELEHAGEEKLHHQGGPMGYQSRDWIVTPTTTAKVGANQAYCWNPTIAGTKSEDGFIVGDSGPEFITGPVCFPVFQVEAGGISFSRPDLLAICGKTF